MASAHWMSLPWDFQPDTHHHARHHAPTMIATPKSELASDEGLGARDRDGDTRTPESGLPPGKVILVTLRGCVWKERTTIEGGEHGLHVCEMSTSRWDDQSSMR